MDNSFNSVPLLYLFLMPMDICTTHFFWFVLHVCSNSLLCINRNSYDILHNIATFVLAWSMFECNVTLQCITQHNSWPGSAQLTSSAQPAWPAPSPGLAWSLSSEVNIQQGNNILYSFHRKFFYLIFMFHILPDHQKRSSTLTLLSLVGFSVQVCMISLPWE